MKELTVFWEDIFYWLFIFSVWRQTFHSNISFTERTVNLLAMLSTFFQVQYHFCFIFLVKNIVLLSNLAQDILSLFFSLVVILNIYIVLESCFVPCPSMTCLVFLPFPNIIRSAYPRCFCYSLKWHDMRFLLQFCYKTSKTNKGIFLRSIILILFSASLVHRVVNNKIPSRVLLVMSALQFWWHKNKFWSTCTHMRSFFSCESGSVF